MWSRKLVLSIISLTFLTGWAQANDYSRLARVSSVEGRVSFQQASDVDWAAASINMALQPSDRIYTGEDGRAEIEFDDGSVLRLAGKTDIEILSLKDDLIQVRILLGLATLTVRSSLDYEISTPAAAFNTLTKGIYRFDVIENGDSDGIVRKGEMEAANNSFSQRAQAEELIHVTAGENGTQLLSRYDRLDEWDEWNDRRNAELNAYESREHIPDYVSVGVSDLDRYGRWVSVEEYGPAWVPSYVDTSWSPYWEGRWCYRPLWGWTWVSYEPWGWLPYHYGRWYHSGRHGWCWLPGASFGFHFWSPGLVRFYHGSNWMSWCPLGPGDYYNVNNYFHHSRYNYYVNDLRLIQRRSPDDLHNRHVPGAFRTVGTEHFLNNGFGRNSRTSLISSVDEPWRRGRMVTDQLDLRPTGRSLLPVPDRPAVRPAEGYARSTVVRSEPSVQPRGQTGITRITNPNIPRLPSPELQGRAIPGSGENREGGSSGTRGWQTNRVEGGSNGTPDNRNDRGSSIWNRRPDNTNEYARPNSGRDGQNTAPRSVNENPRPSGREVPGNRMGSSDVAPRNQERPPSTYERRSSDRGREGPGSIGNRPEPSAPRRQESSPQPAAPRNERPAPEQKNNQERSRPSESRPRPSNDQSSYSYSPRNTVRTDEYRSSYGVQGSTQYGSARSNGMSVPETPSRGWERSGSSTGRSAPSVQSYGRSAPSWSGRSSDFGSGRSAPQYASSSGGSGISRRQGR